LVLSFDKGETVTIIAMWSGPRNISTAMMYSFGNRGDCEACDEPFYGFALKTQGHDHPMRAEIIAAMECDWDTLVAECTKPCAKPLLYQKHMTHHMLPGFDRSFALKLTNAFLIRNPARVLASYAEKWADVDLNAIGFVQQAEIFDMVANHLGHAPPVIDSDDVLADPNSMLSKLCKACGIEFDDAMLHWPKGPKPCDGVWAPHWYNAAWASEGFAKPRFKEEVLAQPLAEIADEAMPYYEKLKQHRIT
jgi:Sulfotransferase domain